MRAVHIGGIHAVGLHASKLAAEATLAIEMIAAHEDIAETIHPHATISEAIAHASRLLLNQPAHALA